MIGDMRRFRRKFVLLLFILSVTNVALNVVLVTVLLPAR